LYWIKPTDAFLYFQRQDVDVENTKHHLDIQIANKSALSALLCFDHNVINFLLYEIKNPQAEFHEGERKDKIRLDLAEKTDKARFKELPSQRTPSSKNSLVKEQPSQKLPSQTTP